MDGFINVLKPPGMSSHAVVAWLRRTFSQEKVGHTGTLDPGAAGVLVLALGKATRLSQFILNYPKQYRCLLRLGTATDSGDVYGNVIGKSAVTGVSRQQLEEVFLKFTGEIQQVPPMTSAVKVKGKKLYQLAREGRTIPREKRTANIYAIKLVKAELGKETAVVIFDVTCSKGTYIRVLCNDIGKELGCGGLMQFLVRTGIGPFRLEDAYTLEQLEANSLERKIFLKPMDTAVEYLPRIKLAGIKDTRRLLNGNFIDLRGYNLDFDWQQEVAVYSHQGEFIAIGKIDNTACAGKKLKPQKVFFSPDTLPV